MEEIFLDNYDHRKRYFNLESNVEPVFESVTLHTDLGDIKLELFCEQCPKTCENFLALCASDYYKECLFHRNIKGFMVQTGDPTDNFLIQGTIGTLCKYMGVYITPSTYRQAILPENNTGYFFGTGKGGTSIWGKKFEDELTDSLKHNVRGVISMANNGPDSNGSQFFITYAKQPHLDLKYTIFGKVLDGFETLDELEKLPVEETTYQPLTDTRIRDVTIHANPLAG